MDSAQKHTKVFSYQFKYCNMLRKTIKVEDIIIKIPLPVFVDVLGIIVVSYIILYNSTKNKQ